MRIQPGRYLIRRVLPVMLVLGAASVHSYTAQAANEQPRIPRGVAMKSWHDNGRDGRYLLQLVQGSFPKAGKPVIGTVTSDTDCDADAEGLSHCRNTIKLPNGSEVTVIDTHEMHRYRCLGAGDQISLNRISGTWIMGTLSGK